MSENTILNVQTTAKESFAKAQAAGKKKYGEEAAQIFDLISQLNDSLKVNGNNVADSSSSSNQKSANGGDIKCATDILKQQQQQQQQQQQEKVTTKIPRMNFVQHSNPPINSRAPPPQPQPPQPLILSSPVQSSQSLVSNHNMCASTSNSSMGSIPPAVVGVATSTAVESHIPRLVSAPGSSPAVGPSSQQTTTSAMVTNNTHSTTTAAAATTSRVPRSIVRNSTLAAAAAEHNAHTPELPPPAPLTPNGHVINTKISGIPKRGVSLSNAPKMKSTRSMSINGDAAGSKENLDDCESVVSSESRKKVRYVIRHKPRESQVKIFSQKVDFKGKSKIGSLEKAATYVPGGGNVKIESHKLSWDAKAKLGSLDHAKTYTPKGGNVKIESHKLNFREKAKPKTDTGLIVVEEYIDTKSYNNSNDDLTKSQLSFTGSN